MEMVRQEAHSSFTILKARQPCRSSSHYNSQKVGIYDSGTHLKHRVSGQQGTAMLTAHQGFSLVRTTVSACRLWRLQTFPALKNEPHGAPCWRLPSAGSDYSQEELGFLWAQSCTTHFSQHVQEQRACYSWYPPGSSSRLLLGPQSIPVWAGRMSSRVGSAHLEAHRRCWLIGHLSYARVLQHLHSHCTFLLFHTTTSLAHDPSQAIPGLPVSILPWSQTSKSFMFPTFLRLRFIHPSRTGMPESLHL